MKDFLLEIGFENIPASFVEPAYKQLCADAEALLQELRLPWEEIYATGTPRRIVLAVGGLAGRQESAEETVTGPPVSRGFDDEGKPTMAAEGFAKSHGLAVGQLIRVDTPKGEYLGFRRKLERRETSALLAERLPGLIRGIKFPKVMKWEESGELFARPIRWLVCMYGAGVVPFRFAGVDSGKTSFGRPWMRGESVKVRSASSYLKDVSALGVIVDDDLRRERVESLALKAARKYGLVLKEDPGLLDEICFMLENPRLIVGGFPERYLRLPPEVVTTAMRSHQRYLALTNKRGALVPKFFTFTDGPVKAPSVVRDGNEKVLLARLEDALFYWHEDLKRGTDGLAAELERIVFIEGLGSLGEKSRRVNTLAGRVNETFEEHRRLGPELISRAAGLAKADLASEMIKDGKEFTLLQGLMGSYYARECGEDPRVAQAIVEHYQPRSPADDVPSSLLGSILGIADRIDTITGCFLAGFIPSGSQDPYGLRRSANGLMRILQAEPAVGIDDLMRDSIQLYLQGGFTDTANAEKSAETLRQFFINRCEFFLKERGVAYDVVAAVSRVAWMRPGVALERALGIAHLRGDDTFERLITGVKRVGNILGKERRTFGAGWDQLRSAFGPDRALTPALRYDPAFFAEKPEHELYEAVKRAAEALVEHDSRRDFPGVLGVLSSLADPIDSYFDRVLVNCEDPALRENRHNFLAGVFALFARYADFLCIVEDGTS